MYYYRSSPVGSFVFSVLILCTDSKYWHTPRLLVDRQCCFERFIIEFATVLQYVPMNYRCQYSRVPMRTIITTSRDHLLHFMHLMHLMK
jgi:hypothetical protein